MIYAEKPYREEAAFVHHCIQIHKPNAINLLELACGTGTHSLLLEKYGYKIVATDYSSDMLARAREKAQNEKSCIDFLKQDMRLLDVPERPFDAIICLFDSLGYVATNESILQVLKNIRNHLAQDGIFLFEFWHAGAMLRNYDPLRIRRFQMPQGEIIRVSETRISYIEQLCYVSYTLNEMNKDGTYQTLEETQLNRFFLVQEMKFFLEQAGLSPLKWFSGFQDNDHIDEKTWHIICAARKA
jgi:SAM-dependent methyltransferase